MILRIITKLELVEWFGIGMVMGLNLDRWTAATTVILYNV